MAPIFLATLGQRPEAITIALDVLLPRYAYSKIGILHTEPNFSGIAEALRDLRQVLREEYAGIHQSYHQITFSNGDPLMDIENQHSAEAYYTAILSLLRDYRLQKQPIHLLVAGGRKAMSIYATLAASIVLGNKDRVWTILSPQEIMKPGCYHIPPGFQGSVHAVQLPILPSRFSQQTLAEMDVTDLLRQQEDPAVRLYEDLTAQETLVVDMLRQHPLATNKQLGELLNKTEKTIEHQLRSVYRKLEKFYDTRHTHKRQLLLEILED